MFECTGKELEEPAFSETGQNGNIEFTEQPPIGNPGQGVDPRRIDANPSRFYSNAKVSFYGRLHLFGEWNHLNLYSIHFFFFRELWEVKGQREELARDLVRKDSQLKEMQQRLESGDGCKYSDTFANVVQWNNLEDGDIIPPTSLSKNPYIYHKMGNPLYRTSAGLRF